MRAPGESLQGVKDISSAFNAISAHYDKFSHIMFQRQTTWNNMRHN